MLPYKKHTLNMKVPNMLKAKGCKITYDNNQKKATVAVVIPDKVYYRVKNIIRGRESHFIMIKWSIHPYH